MRPGPKPDLRVVTDSRRSHRPVPDFVELAKATPDEPDWEQVFSRPARRAELAARRADVDADDDARQLDADNRRCRHVAHQTWQLVVDDLAHARGVLSRIDAVALRDLCVVVARIDQAERELATHGVLVRTERGMVKNPATTVVKSYREQFNRYMAEFGLSPSARTRLRADFLTDDGEGLFD